MSRTTQRLIQLLETVNPTAVNNDDGSRASSSQSCAASPPSGQLINAPLWKRWSARRWIHN